MEKITSLFAKGLMRLKGTFTIALIVILFSSCAPTIKTRMQVPAKSHEAAQLRRIAVINFSGRGGDQVRADIEALLVNIRVKDEPYFSIIERAAVNKVLEEQALQMTGVVDSQTAAKIGGLLGTDGIVMGVISNYITEDKHYSEKRSKCVAKDKKGKCIRRSKYSVGCTERNAYFSFTPKVVNVSSGEIVTSEVLSGHSCDSVCRDSRRALKDRSALLGSAKSQAIEKFRELVAPYSVVVELKIITKDDTKMVPEVKKKIKSGVLWAKEGRLDRACEFWNDAYNLHPRGYAMPYLLGICSETSGNLETAFGYYEKADKNTGSPVKEISEALGRVKLSMEKQKKLKEQLSK